VLAVIIAQHPLKTDRAKKRFVTAVILLALAAAGANIYAQYHDQSQKAADKAQQAAIRDQLGVFIKEGSVLRDRAVDESKPIPLDEANQLDRRVEAFLRDKLGASYVVRYENADGLPMLHSGIRSPEHNSLWAQISYRLMRLNQFLEQLPA
jgi:hypothetical protein